MLCFLLSSFIRLDISRFVVPSTRSDSRQCEGTRACVRRCCRFFEQPYSCSISSSTVSMSERNNICRTNPCFCFHSTKLETRSILRHQLLLSLLLWLFSMGWNQLALWKRFLKLCETHSLSLIIIMGWDRGLQNEIKNRVNYHLVDTQSTTIATTLARARAPGMRDKRLAGFWCMGSGANRLI